MRVLPSLMLASLLLTALPVAADPGPTEGPTEGCQLVHSNLPRTDPPVVIDPNGCHTELFMCIFGVAIWHCQDWVEEYITP